MNYTNSIGLGISLALTLIGMLYTYKCWRIWRNSTIPGVCVEVAQCRSFLSNNFKLILLVWTLNGLHVVIGTLESLDLGLTAWLQNIFNIIYHLNMIIIMSAYLVLAISWYKLLSKINQWDERWKILIQ